MLQQESGTTRIIDPWGGSFYVERLTYDLAARALDAHRGGREVRRHGQGHRGRHPQAHDRAGGDRHARRASTPGTQTIVGVNKYRPDSDADIAILKVDNRSVRRQQLDKLARLKAERDESEVAAAPLTR